MSSKSHAIDQNARGAYCVLMELRKGKKIKAGSLGESYFPAGYYVYVGSALGGLQARISRHFHKRKKLRWHVDYLLKEAQILRAVAVESENKIECELRARVAGICGAKNAARGFGSSDCSCYSHLLRFERNPLRKLCSKLNSGEAKM